MLPPDRALRILFVSAHALWGEACRQGLAASPHPITVELLITEERLSRQLAGALIARPHVVVVSLDSPAGDLALVETLRAAGSRAPILVLCSQYAVPSLAELQRYDVQGVVGSRASLEELGVAIYAVADGTAGPLLPQCLRAVRPLYYGPVPLVLNERELDLLRLVARDLTDREIARHLGLGVRTVSNELCELYGKLGVHGRVGATVSALVHGWIPVPHMDPWRPPRE